MTDSEKNNAREDLLADPELTETQRLLLSLEPPEEGEYDLEDILAEYGDARSPGKPAAAKPESVPPAPEPESAITVEPAADAAGGVIAPEPPPEPESRIAPERPSPRQDAPAPGPAPGPEASGEPSDSLRDVVASTVDEVKAEQDALRRRIAKRIAQRRRKSAPERRRPAVPEDVGNEPSAAETANRHRRRYRECRRGLRVAVPLLILLWLPWLLAWCGAAIPFFSDNTENAAICVLIPQAAICLFCWPVFRAAWEGVRARAWDLCVSAALASIVTLLDEMTLLLLPGRSDVYPLGGAAGALTVFALWGLTGTHGGLTETFRVAAMGTPNRVVDVCEQGVAKGAGDVKGFYTRAVLEDGPAQWQRLVLPVLAAASAVFSVLSTVGQGRSQDLLWCLSVILCASSPLTFPLAFAVPFGRIAARMARHGAAAAGCFGAAALSADRRLVVTDTDLFPAGSVMLAGERLYGEEGAEALAYAASLAAEGGGLLRQVFARAAEADRVSLCRVEDFHIYEGGGLGGMIGGETVLLGTPAFMRRQAVRLPARLPFRTSVCLASDGQLLAIFSLRYSQAEPVAAALRMAKRSGLRLTLATRDGNITPRLLRSVFGVSGAETPELRDRLALSDPERPAGAPNGILYREGLLPLTVLTAGSRRLSQAVRLGDLLAVTGGVAGALLGFYLTFTGSYAVLTPLLIMIYMLLWTAPMLPMLLGVDKL